MGGEVRVPTPDVELYRWHTEALAGMKPATTEEPRCGWFVRRMESKAPLLPASIYMAREIDAETGELLSDEILRCEVGGINRDPEDEWLWLASRPISEAEYLRLMAELFSADEYRGPQRTRARWIEDAGKEERHEQVRANQRIGCGSR